MIRTRYQRNIYVRGRNHDGGIYDKEIRRWIKTNQLTNRRRGFNTRLTGGTTGVLFTRRITVSLYAIDDTPSLRSAG